MEKGFDEKVSWKSSSSAQTRLKDKNEKQIFYVFNLNRQVNRLLLDFDLIPMNILVLKKMRARTGIATVNKSRVQFV